MATIVRIAYKREREPLVPTDRRRSRPSGAMIPRDATSTAIMPAMPAMPNVSRQTSGASPVSSAPSDIRPGRMKWSEITKDEPAPAGVLGHLLVAELDDHPPEAEERERHGRCRRVERRGIHPSLQRLRCSVPDASSASTVNPAPRPAQPAGRDRRGVDPLVGADDDLGRLDRAPVAQRARRARAPAFDRRRARFADRLRRGARRRGRPARPGGAVPHRRSTSARSPGVSSTAPVRTRWRRRSRASSCDDASSRSTAIDDVRRAVDAAAIEVLADQPQGGQRRASLERLGPPGVALGEDPLELADPGPLEEGRGQLGRGPHLAVDEQADREPQAEQPEPAEELLADLLAERVQLGIAEPIDRAAAGGRGWPRAGRRPSRSQPNCASRSVAPVSAISPATGTTPDASSRTRASPP